MRERIHGKPTLAAGPLRTAALEAAGWSENDANLFMSYGHFDEELFSVERVTRAAELAEGRTWIEGAWKRSLRNLGAQTWLFVLWAGCLWLLALLWARDSRTRWALVVSELLATGIAFRLLWTHKLPERVFVSILIAVSAISVASWRRNWTQLSPKLQLVVGLTSLMTLVGLQGHARWTERERLSELRDATASFHATLKSKVPDEALVIAWGYAYPAAWMPVFDDPIEEQRARW